MGGGGLESVYRKIKAGRLYMRDGLQLRGSRSTGDYIL